MDKPLKRIFRTVHKMNEEAPTMSVGAGQIAGTKEAGDLPPVDKKKRKPTPVGRYGSRRAWLANLKEE